MAGKCYSVDTSALIDGLERYYPASTFAGLWEAIDVLVTEGRFVVSAEVWEEVKKKDEVVKDWVEPRQDNLVVPTTATIAQEVQAILNRFPRMVMTGGRRNRADPFVVAVAKLQGATVITGEELDGNDRRPKIPFVCKELGVDCIRFTDLIVEEQWKFTLS